MRNLTGYLKKILLFFNISLVLFLSIFLSFKCFADESAFNVNVTFKHTVESSEVENVADVSIRANSTSRVLSYYTITIPVENISPKVTLVNSSKDFNAQVYPRDGATDITVTFSDLVVSPDQDTVIRIVYTTPADISGTRYTFHSEITDLETNSIEIKYAKSLGEVIWSSNTLSKLSAQGDYYIADISNPSSYDTVLVFGDAVVYDFQISRTLSNSLQESSESFEITLPQDNLTQTLIISSMDPMPDSSSVDDEGNLTVSYTVDPGENINVKITGQIVEIDSDTQVSTPQDPFLTEETSYWKITDTQEFSNIQRYIDRNWISLPDGFESIADFTEDSDKETFYKAIYEYIVNRLSVDSTSLTVLQGGARKGAESVLEDVAQSDADDYADLCVAVYRHYGIPARMNIGFLTDVSGITEDGIFHSWCEYYDGVEKRWVEVDPFLEDYKNVDLYGNELKDHIKIITRGKSSVSPKLAFYSESQFQADSSSSSAEPSLDFKVKLEFEDNKTTSKYVKGYIKVTNTGNIPISKYQIEEETLPIKENIDLTSNERTFLLLPGESISIPFNIPSEDISEDENKKVNISLSCSSESQYTKTYSASDILTLSVPWYINILSYLICTVILAGVGFLIYFVYRKI